MFLFPVATRSLWPLDRLKPFALSVSGQNEAENTVGILGRRPHYGYPSLKEPSGNASL